MNALASRAAQRALDRHEAGLYALAMDDQASSHYGEATGGLVWTLWRVKLYCRGFLSNA
jgi:hypothetical protein